VRVWFKRKSSKADAGERPTYEVGEFSIKHSLSIFEARRILREAGQTREQADAVALKKKLRHVISG
jgi:hypothetical protein